MYAAKRKKQGFRLSQGVQGVTPEVEERLSAYIWQKATVPEEALRRQAAEIAFRKNEDNAVPSSGRRILNRFSRPENGFPSVVHRVPERRGFRLSQARTMRDLPEEYRDLVGSNPHGAERHAIREEADGRVVVHRWHRFF